MNYGGLIVSKNQKVKIIPLGGLNEIGKNLTVFECGKDLIVLDCGIAFPDEDMPGIDMVIPDMTYLEKNASKIRGVVLTHGHEDHIGGIPFLLKKLNVPIYGTRLTLGLVEVKLKEHNLLSKTKLVRVTAGETIKLGDIKVEFIHNNHSIADSVAIAFHTPVGIIVHSGDFKLDSTPIEGSMMDIARLGELGNRGVLALLSDSTNVERPGYTMSESTVGETFDDLFRGCDRRIFVATFASNVHRVQQIINAAYRYGRKVAFSGRSMENVVEVAMQLGYMTVPENVIISIDDIKKYKANQVVIITTGSQGEAMSALSRMAYSDHKKVEISKGDLVIVSASPIPGNEKAISNVINELFKKGAEVVYKSLENIHVSGHACQEELKLMLTLTKPKFFIPVHGEFRHLKLHALLAESVGISNKNIIVGDIGKVIELTNSSIKINGSVPSGAVLIDGLGIGDVGNIVLRDRKHLAQDGIIIVVVTIDKKDKSILSGPDVLSRGFVYVRESEDLMEESKAIALQALHKCVDSGATDWNSFKGALKSALGDFVYAKTKRKPMILPVIMEV
ncbi:MAG: ribonuclease J [Ruminococcaceae bacterium]|nr:ribonuclease J [Oscillospiraceae bacterium]